jgi:hypothetical protein
MANGFAEAPASWKVRYTTPDGFSCQLTLRGENGAELLPKTAVAIEWLQKNGCTPNGAKPIVAKGNAAYTGVTRMRRHSSATKKTDRFGIRTRHRTARGAGASDHQGWRGGAATPPPALNGGEYGKQVPDYRGGSRALAMSHGHSAQDGTSRRATCLPAER